MVREVVEGPGRPFEWWGYDPEYRPRRLPAGAVRGDVSKQVFCSAHNGPKYFYVDEDRKCTQCGAEFTFRAAEQKYWYETLKFNFSSVPIRCVRCRRQRRSEHALREQIARAKADSRKSPGDPGAHIAVARAIVEHHERTGRGSLDEAIAEARRAAQLLPQAAEPLFWEGVAQARARRKGQARECLTRFLAKQPDGGENRAMAKIARAYLDGQAI